MRGSYRLWPLPFESAECLFELSILLTVSVCLYECVCKLTWLWGVMEVRSIVVLYLFIYGVFFSVGVCLLFRWMISSASESLRLKVLKELLKVYHGSQWQFIDLSNAWFTCRTQMWRYIFYNTRSQNWCYTLLCLKMKH